MSYLPIPRDIWRQLRRWCDRTRAGSEPLQAIFDDKDEAAADFLAKTSSKGRARALRRLRARFEPPARWHGMHDHAAIWAFLQARETPYVKPCGSLLQDVAIIRYLAIGGRRSNGHAPMESGLWTLELTVHALARAIQRHGSRCDLDSIIWNGHAHALALPAQVLRYQRDALDQGYQGLEFRLKAEPGCFGTTFALGVEPEGRKTLYLRCSTWNHWDELSERQEREIPQDAEPGQHKLGDDVLNPLRRRVPTAPRDGWTP